MPYVLPDGTTIPTWDELKNLLGAIPGWWDAVTSGNPIDIFEWLFGGGHAGSCGAFREQYFGVKNNLDPVFDVSDKAWATIGVQEHPTPTEVMNQFGSTVASVIDIADSQFDQFKGSNLLGQTMFASRLHLYLFLRWMGSQTFGIAQWAQERYLFTLDQIQQQGNAIIGLQGDTQDLVRRALVWDADHQFIVAIQGEVAKLQTAVDHINNIDIPALKAQDASFINAINNLIDPAIARAQLTADIDAQIITGQILPALKVEKTQIHKINQKIKNRINPRIHNALQQIRNIGQNTIPQIDQQLQSLQALVPQVLEIPQIQQSLITLGQQISQQEQQKTQTILPQLAQLAQALAQLANQLQNEIIPHQEFQGEQITNILNYLTVYVQVNIELLLSQTTDIYNQFTTLVYPQISIFQQFIANIDVHIKNVLSTNCQVVWDCLTRHRTNNPTDSCAEGRTWWGTWAECWLDAHTSSDIDLQATDAVPHTHILNANDIHSNEPSLEGAPFRTHLLRIDLAPQYIFAPETTV